MNRDLLFWPSELRTSQKSRLSGIRKVKDNSAGQRNWTAARLPIKARGTEAPSQFKGLRGGLHGCAAQAIPQIDADSAVVAKKAAMAKSAIAEKGHLRMETSLNNRSKFLLEAVSISFDDSISATFTKRS